MIKNDILTEEKPVTDADSECAEEINGSVEESQSEEKQDIKKSKKYKKNGKRRRRFGDRKDGRKLRTIPPMHRIMPYIMAKRSDAQNTYADSFDITEVERFCRRKVKEGYTNFGMLHIILAAYVRVVSQRPGVNRFISGQKVYARNNIEVVMAVKKHMSLDGAETCIKVEFEPTDTIDDVYRKFNEVVMENVGNDDESNFDNLAKVLNYIPGLLLRWTVKFLNFLDYFGWLPRKLTWLSPFHGSMIITSMGSLGIKPIYHHIYDFGNLPVFFAYGVKRTKVSVDKDGNVIKKRYIDLKAVTDERICDGYYYASAFKLLKRYVEHPECLEMPPEKVYEDID